MHRILCFHPKVFRRFSVILKMKPRMNKRCLRRLIGGVLCMGGLCLPAAQAAWQVVMSEQGKRVEIERNSIVNNPKEGATALGRIVLDRPIVDPRTSLSYQTIEVLNRYDCAGRTYATLKRSYFQENGEMLRQEEVKTPYDMLVRSGTPDDRLFREVCRPAGTAGSGKVSAGQTLQKVNALTTDVRQHNEALIEKEVKKETQRLAASASATLTGKPPVAAPVPRRAPVSTPSRKRPSAPVASPSAHVSPAAWSYRGAGGPETWGRLRPEYALCATGQRQSPIDIRDAFAVDLEPIRFAYKPSAFRVRAANDHLAVATYGGSLTLLGKAYVLTHLQFHRPAEMALNGQRFAMDVQLFHRAEDGEQLIVNVLLEPGAENPAIQQVLNHLPLEKGSELAPPYPLDVEAFLPAQRQYATFLGSLTTPPCTEEVLWLVLKQPLSLSPEQLAIFERLYLPNARPLQPTFGRIIKESR